MSSRAQSTARRVLFVDDEPMLLQGLSRMLRTEKDIFVPAFATSGEEALAMLLKDNYDVVVSDISMPHMNGLELLSRVKELYPDTVRIILSGEPDVSLSIQSVNVSHRFLNKPCDPALLKSTILRTCRLSDFLRNDSMKKTLKQIDSLPSMPAVYFEIVKELQSPDASIQKVGQIISRDVALTSKILQLVNSAYFSLPRHVSSPEHAALLLGLNIIKSLVLVSFIFKKFDRMDMPYKFLERLWAHNILTGNLAKAIAKEESQDQKVIDNAYIAGLLHDCGKLILASSFKEKYREIIIQSHEEGIPISSAEEALLGVTHAEVGAYLMELWGLPAQIIEAIAFHHLPSEYGDEAFSPLSAVHIANELGHKEPDNGPEGYSPVFDIDYLKSLNLDNRLDRWLSIREKIANGAN
ncbi:MAG: HDOD domain-containing protein [Deltaproteobacteria bacterium]|nr:HDOD domain-containing protein [Deltaproteobacteria bacterium]